MPEGTAGTSTGTPVIDDEAIVAPIDFVLLEFSPDRLTGEAAPALMDLVERGVIRLFDLRIVRKAEDGTVQVVDITDPLAAKGGFSTFAGASSGILGVDDIRQATDAMAPGTVAALIVYENTWAARFVAAVRQSGGELIASARIPATDIIEALDALDATD
ncbi:DUF6325 family protein [Arthrobacter sp. TMS1-12-1]